MAGRQGWVRRQSQSGVWASTHASQSGHRPRMTRQSDFPPQELNHRNEMHTRASTLKHTPPWTTLNCNHGTWQRLTSAGGQGLHEGGLAPRGGGHRAHGDVHVGELGVGLDALVAQGRVHLLLGVRAGHDPRWAEGGGWQMMLLGLRAGHDPW